MASLHKYFEQKGKNTKWRTETEYSECGLTRS